jgi:hypothetical protein
MLNQIAEHIFVKNLRRRSDRRELMVEQLDALGISYTFLDVADHLGTKMNATWWNAHNGLIPFRYAKAAKMANVMIMDDDCLFVENFNQKLTALWLQMPQDWDWVSFGEIYGNKVEIVPGIVKADYSWGGQAVLVKNTVFDRCLENITGETWADEEFNIKIKKFINFYAFCPYLITQRSDFSDLKNEYVRNDHFS